MLIQRLSSLHQYLREWKGWVDHPPSQPYTASTGTLDAWIWWKSHLVFQKWMDEEKSTHYLADRSSGYLACQIRKQAYPKLAWESSIHWCGREYLKILRGTRIHMPHQAYSSTFLCQHNELALPLAPLWVWRVFWSIVASPCPPSTGGSWKEWEDPLEEPFRMKRRGLSCCSECNEGHGVVCSKWSEGDW